jgi:hypothetical protein
MVDIKTITEVVDNIVTSGAVVIGGIWAYFKFIRGRTFAHRAELNSTVALERTVGRSYLCVTVSLKNTGLSKLPLEKDMKVMRLFGAAGEVDGRIDAAKWERLMTLPMLQHHEWLEAQETVTDTMVYSLPGVHEFGPHYAAYQVEAIVGASRNLITRKGTSWRSNAFVFLPTSDLGNDRDLNLSREISLESAEKASMIKRVVKQAKERWL